MRPFEQKPAQLTSQILVIQWFINSVRRDTKVQKFTEICYKANITLSTLQVYNHYVFADRCYKPLNVQNQRCKL